MGGLAAHSILLPVALGLASASLLFWGFYSPSIGPINPILQPLGLIHEPISFLGTSLSALLSTTFLIVWKYAGLYMLILLVGLQAIPDELYEAAALDGATRWQASGTSPCRCCDRRSRCPSSCASPDRCWPLTSSTS